MPVWRRGELRNAGAHYDWATEPSGVGFPRFRPPLLAGEHVDIGRPGGSEIHRAARNGQLPECCDCGVCRHAVPGVIVGTRFPLQTVAAAKPTAKRARKTAAGARQTRAKKTAKKSARKATTGKRAAKKTTTVKPAAKTTAKKRAGKKRAAKKRV